MTATRRRFELSHDRSAKKLAFVRRASDDDDSGPIANNYW
jgi:hypothetical protein